MAEIFGDIFRATRAKIAVPALNIGKTSMQPSAAFRCLGLILHERLCYGEHIRGVTSKCYAVIATIRRLRAIGLPRDGLILVYKALLVPLLTYCISI